MQRKKIRALSLFSGSLASRIASRVVEHFPNVEEIVLLYFRCPYFGGYERIREIVKEEWPGVYFRTQTLKKEYRRLANIAPEGCFSLESACLSCRTIMLSHAIRYMERIGADCIVTGEVMGKNGLFEKEMLQIEEALGISGLVLRPLSGRLLPATKAERAGKIGRSALGSLTVDDGAELANIGTRLGLLSADGLPTEVRCKLTSHQFGTRLEDLLGERGFNISSLKLLDFALYYKVPPDVKIVVAENEEEKRMLQNFFLPHDLRVYVPVRGGSMTLVRANWARKSRAKTEEIIEIASRITATHSETVRRSSMQVNYRFENDDETLQLNVFPFSSEKEICDYCCVPVSPYAGSRESLVRS
ncbi:MAG: hypothetical protein V3S76_04335 [Candidatus Bipolaricaulota bacterium]